MKCNEHHTCSGLGCDRPQCDDCNSTVEPRGIRRACGGGTTRTGEMATAVSCEPPGILWVHPPGPWVRTPAGIYASLPVPTWWVIFSGSSAMGSFSAGGCARPQCDDCNSTVEPAGIRRACGGGTTRTGEMATAVSCEPPAPGCLKVHAGSPEVKIVMIAQNDAVQTSRTHTSRCHTL